MALWNQPPPTGSSNHPAPGKPTSASDLHLPQHMPAAAPYFTTAADLAARCHRAAIEGRLATTMRFYPARPCW
jgi:hypothetical protein